MTPDFTFLLFAIPAVIFAGVSKGGFGSGAAFAATPLLALILEPAQAVGLMLPLLMLMDVGALKPYWRKWDMCASRVLLIGSVPGIVLGAALFRVANPDLFRLLIGCIAIGFVLFQMARHSGAIQPERLNMPDTMGYLFGALAGFTSFVSHAGGPPAAVYLLSRKLSKTSYQATTVLVFWLINLLKIGPFMAMGMVTFDMWVLWAMLAPFALLGGWLGVVAHRLVPEKVFFALAYVFLLATGAKLISQALW